MQNIADVGRTQWALVLAIWAAGLGAAAQYGKISVIFGQMSDLYPDAGAGIGFTVSLVGFLGILLGVLAGSVVAALGFRRTLVGALWVGAAMSGLQALHLPFEAFLASRVIEGLSHLGLVVAAPTLIAQISAERDRGATLTLWGTFFGVAFALLAWIGVPFALAFGPLSLFAAHAVLMSALALGLQVVLRDVPVPERQPLPAPAAWPGLHLKIYRSPRMNAPAAGWLCYTTCFVSVLTVLPPYIDPQLRAVVMGLMPLASIVSSLTLGVFLLRHISAVQLIELGFALCAASMVWLWLMPGDPVACVALAAAMGLVQGATFAAVPQLNDSTGDRASSNGAMAQAGNLGNTIGTPIMVAVLSVAGYTGLMLTMMLVYFAGLAVHLWLAARRATR